MDESSFVQPTCCARETDGSAKESPDGPGSRKPTQGLAAGILKVQREATIPNGHRSRLNCPRCIQLISNRNG
jgi:hypothetical protein